MYRKMFILDFTTDSTRLSILSYHFMIFADHDKQIGTFIILHQKKWEIARVYIK